MLFIDKIIKKGLVFQSNGDKDIFQILDYDKKRNYVELILIEDPNNYWEGNYLIGDTLNYFTYHKIEEWFMYDKVTILKNYKGRDTKLWKTMNED